MALTVGDLSAHTREKVFPDIVDVAIENEPMWDFMVQNGMVTAEGGDEIRRPLLYDRNSVQWFNKRDKLETDTVDKRTHARYQWRYAAYPLNISEIDLRNNNGNIQQIISLLETEKEAAQQGFAEAMGSGLFSSGGNPGGVSTGRQIDGFGSYIGTGAFGDITPSDLANADDWKSTSVAVNDNNGKLVKSDIQKRLLASVSQDFNNKTPDLAVCNMDVWSKIWELLQPHQQLQGTNVEPGFSSFSWNGMIDFIVDSRAPGSGRGTADNKIYFFRKADLEFVRHQDAGMSMSDFESPKNQKVLISFMELQGNLAPKQRKFSAELTGIDPAL